MHSIIFGILRWNGNTKTITYNHNQNSPILETIRGINDFSDYHKQQTHIHACSAATDESSEPPSKKPCLNPTDEDPPPTKLTKTLTKA